LVQTIELILEKNKKSLIFEITYNLIIFIKIKQIFYFQIISLQMKKKENLPWTEKYRPVMLDDLCGHQDKITLAKEFIKKSDMPHFLLFGPPGSGKTSFILAYVRELYGKTEYKKYILELNASDERGIGTVRNDITTFIRLSSNKPKLVILDEADAMTGDAQGALRRIMETHINVARFCLICNDYSKIINGVSSRCTQLMFGALKATDIKKRILEIVEKEKINITDEAISTLASLNKDLRQIMNILQCLHTIYNLEKSQIDNDAVYKYIGKPSKQYIIQLIEYLFSHNIKENISMLDVVYCKNEYNFIHILEDLTDVLIHLFYSDGIKVGKGKDIKKIELSELQLQQILENIADVNKFISNGRSIKLCTYKLGLSFILN
jgi:replication factor C subunit 3/5